MVDFKGWGSLQRNPQLTGSWSANIQLPSTVRQVRVRFLYYGTHRSVDAVSPVLILCNLVLMNLEKSTILGRGGMSWVPSPHHIPSLPQFCHLYVARPLPPQPQLFLNNLITDFVRVESGWNPRLVSCWARSCWNCGRGSADETSNESLIWRSSAKFSRPQTYVNSTHTS